MIFHNGQNEKTAPPLLVRGDSEGQVTIWTLPQVSERQMTLVRQESFDRLPGKALTKLYIIISRP